MTIKQKQFRVLKAARALDEVLCSASFTCNILKPIEFYTLDKARAFSPCVKELNESLQDLRLGAWDRVLAFCKGIKL